MFSWISKYRGKCQVTLWRFQILNHLASLGHSCDCDKHRRSNGKDSLNGAVVCNVQDKLVVSWDLRFFFDKTSKPLSSLFQISLEPAWYLVSLRVYGQSAPTFEVNRDTLTLLDCRGAQGRHHDRIPVVGCCSKNVMRRVLRQPFLNSYESKWNLSLSKYLKDCKYEKITRICTKQIHDWEMKENDQSSEDLGYISYFL